MNLIDENVEQADIEKKKKIITIIVATIAILIILAILIVVYTTIKSNNTLKLNINNTNKGMPDGLVLMDNKKDAHVENNNIYISVKKMAAILGVDYYNDEYKNKGEDTTKCYIKTSNEYTSFISDSSKIYKAIILDDIENEENTNNNTVNSNTTSKDKNTAKTTEYEYFNIDNSVKYVNGEIYVSQEAIKLGFNVSIIYDASTKTIKVYTLDALEKSASSLATNAVIGDDCDYYNKKLLKYGLVLVKNADGNYGIANYYNYSEGNYVVSCKYSKIRFVESTNTLIVTTASDKKQGILALDLINQTAKVKLDPKYQLIKQMDESLELYLVKENGKYGIIDANGNVIAKSEYQAIGINESDKYVGMDNKYVINQKYIPVESDNKWGIITVSGRIQIATQYDGIGCYLGESGTGDGVICLPSLLNGVDGIVFSSNVISNDNKIVAKSYFIVNAQTGDKIGLDAIEIYAKFENNETVYYMKVTNNNNIIKIDIYKQFGKKLETTNTTLTNTTSNSVTNTVNNQ